MVSQEEMTIRPGIATSTSTEERIRTNLGVAYWAESASLMERLLDDKSVDLIMTSPPFGLVRKKEYGNADASDYVDWFRPFAKQFARVLKPKGSLVIDIGGAWNAGKPTKSLYHYELLLCLCKEFGFHLAQEFFLVESFQVANSRGVGQCKAY